MAASFESKLDCNTVKKLSYIIDNPYNWSKWIYLQAVGCALTVYNNPTTLSSIVLGNFLSRDSTHTEIEGTKNVRSKREPVQRGPDLYYI
jgi:hypothetical protein